jgi:hypothetical protein
MPEAFHGFLEPYPLREMTEEEAQLFLQLCISDNGDEATYADMREHFCNDFGYRVVAKRFKVHGIPATPPVIVCVASFCVPRTNGSAAQLVVGAWTLAQQYKNMGRPPMMRVSDFITGAFAHGWPDFSNRKAWDDCWAAQKHGPINLIDVFPWI